MPRWCQSHQIELRHRHRNHQRPLYLKKETTNVIYSVNDDDDVNDDEEFVDPPKT